MDQCVFDLGRPLYCRLFVGRCVVSGQAEGPVVLVRMMPRCNQKHVDCGAIDRWQALGARGMRAYSVLVIPMAERRPSANPAPRETPTTHARWLGMWVSK